MKSKLILILLSIIFIIFNINFFMKKIKKNKKNKKISLVKEIKQIENPINNVIETTNLNTSTNPKELIRSSQYKFPDLQYKDPEIPLMINYVDISNQKSLDKFKNN